MLTTLKSIIQEINQIAVLDDALGRLALRLKEAMKVDSTAIYLADYEQQHFTLMATEGLAKEAIGKVTIGFSEGLIGLIGQREEPLNISDAHSHPSFKHYPEVQEEDYHAFLGTPIIHRRKVLGVLTLQQKRKRRFSQDEEAFLVTLAAQLASEISHAEARGSINKSDDPKQQYWRKSLRGVPGSTGLAVGRAYVLDLKVALRNHIHTRSSQPGQEISKYRNAVKVTRQQVQDMSKKIEGTVPEDVRGIFQVYEQLLDANSLGREVEQKIALGWDAATSLKLVVDVYITQFQNMKDAYMRERAVDVEDVSNRIFANMLNESQTEAAKSRILPDNSILVAEEVTASMLAEFPLSKLRGIISVRGSNNSHAAILARAMGLPAVMGLSDIPLSLLNDKEILLDGYSGEVIVAPDAATRNAFQILVDEEQQLSQLVMGQADLPAVTRDGCAIALLINAGLSAELENSHSISGEGVGLYRTEVPFMMRQRFPSEREQLSLYRSMLEAYPDKLVTMRTLDVGGDKPLPYFPISEENPFLGWRGIRLTLDHPEIFLVQIRAMLRASVGLNNLQIMLPMVTSVTEVNESRRLIRQAFHEVEEEARDKGQILTMPKIGVMLEVPAVLYQLPQLASKVDFFSVGSNDLTQYLLAVDRNNARVADLYDSYHPAVLAALQTIVQQSNQLNVPVTVCGELAGEPGGALLLMAMGYRKLSMNSHNLQKIKWVLRSVSLQDTESLLAEILLLEQPKQVRERINIFLETMGVGGLVRAGI